MPESMQNVIYRAVKQYRVRFHEIFLDNAMFYIKKEVRRLNAVNMSGRYHGTCVTPFQKITIAFLSIRLPNYDINRIPAFHPLRDRSSLGIFGAQCRKP